MRWNAAAVFASIALIASSAQAADPSNYIAEAAQLGPGDTLRLDPGTYADCLELIDVHGTANAPIVITGPESGPPAVFTAAACIQPNRLDSTQIKLLNASYIVIRNIEFNGEDMFVDGIEAQFEGCESVHHITIENNYFHDQDGDSGVNAISSKCNAWDWVIRNNVIENPGLGLYLGDSPGDAPFIRGTIEYNVIINSRGYGMQIKHQIPRPNVPGIPSTQSVTYIRHNVFMKAARATTGNGARPNLLVGHFPPSGSGVDDRYEIYGNLFFQNDNDTEALFQGEGNVALHDNLFVNTFAGPAILVQPHNDVPKEIAIYRNTVLAATNGIIVSGGEPGFQQRVIGNAVFAANPITADDQVDNIRATLAGAAQFVTDPTPILGQLDLYPLVGQLTGSALDLSAYSAYADASLDFNGATRLGTFRGAYGGEGANPGWMLAAAIKSGSGAVPPPTDAGVPTADSGMPSPPDAGTTPSPDAGPPPPDSGATMPPADAGVSTAAPDATAASADTGVASPSPDGASSDNRRSGRTGGGCRCVPAREPWAFAGLLIVPFAALLRRRRVG